MNLWIFNFQIFIEKKKNLFALEIFLLFNENLKIENS